MEWVFVILSIIMSIVWGGVTHSIMDRKGYYSVGWFWFGFFLGIIGLIVALSRTPNYTTSSVAYSPSHSSMDDKMLLNGGWKCPKCGRVNPSYTGTCACGQSKNVNQPQTNTNTQTSTQRSTPQPRPAPQPEGPKSEPEDFGRMREYKKLLDEGIITQEEFDAKKKEILHL